MCGIIGINSNKPVSATIINSLKKLEYRGYDSAGISLFSEQKITLANMEKSISNSSKFGIFDLSNSFLEGNRKRTVRIIETLRAEGTQPPLVLWALSKEINNLYKVLEQGTTKNIWGPRYYLDLLSKRSSSLSYSKIKDSLKDIAEIDAAIKGLSDKNPWQSIRDLALDF